MATMRIISSLIIIILTFAAPAFCLEAHDLEKIVVSPSSFSSQDRVIKSAYHVESVYYGEIEESKVDSLADLVDYVSGLDLRWRSRCGIQGDLSVRGSTYEQVAVLIDGVRVTDPQTGHHNLDIPLTVFDIERIDIIKEPASSLYGAGALAGAINVITKKPERRFLKAEYLFGEHALHEEGVSFAYPDKDLSVRSSFEHKSSNGARSNTDFDYKTGSFYINKELDSVDIDTLVGYQKKDFGADSFYSNLFPEEEEHTETLFSRSGMIYRLNPGLLRQNLYFRKHRDKFILRRNNPNSVNYHTTYLYGLNSQLSIPSQYGESVLGWDIGNDEIYSSNLGKHKRFNQAVLLGFTPRLGKRWEMDFRARASYHQQWDWVESFNFGSAYQIIEDKLKIRSSLSRAFRIPSFTELYYRDAANVGNSGLKVEKSDNFALGLLLTQGTLELRVDGFLRKGKDLIDWTRSSTSEPWQATNIGRVDFEGIEFASQISGEVGCEAINLNQAAFSYNYMQAKNKNNPALSKYALDILKHQLILKTKGRLLGLDFGVDLSYNQRYYGESYFVGDMVFSRKIKVGGFIFEPFIKIDNFTDTDYTEVASVPQPGRWLKSGVKFEW